MREIILTSLCSGVVVFMTIMLWDSWPGKIIRKAIKSHMEKEAKKCDVVFIDPR